MTLTVERLTQLAIELAQGATILTPNYRSSDQLTEQCYRAIAHRQPTFQQRPAILAIDLWLSDLWRQLAQWNDRDQWDNSDVLSWHVLQPAEEHLLWHKVIRQRSPDLLLLNEEGAASEAAAAWRLLQQWQIPLAELRQQLSFANDENAADDCETAWHWFNAFDRYCRQQRLLSFSDMLHALLHLLTTNSKLAKTVLPPRILLWGFDNPPPLYNSLLQVFAANGVQVDNLAASKQTPQMAAHCYSQISDECQAAARWAKHLIDHDPTARIGIISADSDVLKGELVRCFAQQFQDQPALVTNTLVGKIADEPFVHTALAVLELVQPAMKTLTLCALLRSPFLVGQEQAEQDARAELELVLRKRGNLTVTLVDVRELSADKNRRYHSPQLAKALASAQQVQLRQTLKQKAQKQSLQLWFQHFEQVWELLVPRAQLAANGMTLVLRSWDKLLTQVQLSSHLLGLLSFKEALSTLHTLARANSVVSPTHDGPILLLTPVMATGLHFTHCWQLQMTESLWPLATTPHPYLPLTLQRQHNMPGVDATVNLQQSRALLQSLRERTQHHVIYSYAQLNEGQPERVTQLLPPVALQQIPLTANNLRDELSNKSSALTLVSQAGGTLEQFNDSVVHPLAAHERQQGGSKLLSDQSACPFRAFATQRLRVRELPTLAYGIPSHAIGDCIHEVLQRFWQQLQHSAALHSSTEAELTDLLKPAIHAALQTVAQRYPALATPTWLALEEQRLLGLLLVWLEQEKQRGAFSVLGTETELRFMTAQLELRLRIDRIDRQDDGTNTGTTVIVDYKSGRSKSMNWQDQRPAYPQLLLYHAAASQSGRFGPTTALLYGNLYVGSTTYTGISADDSTLPNTHFANNKTVSAESWAALVELWHKVLLQLATEFVEGYAAVQPARHNSCEYCTLDSFCRVKELRSFAEDDEDTLAEDDA
jgi:ATP-dependent helicase/nuclease subunit B